MASFWSSDTRFKPTEIERFPATKKSQNSDSHHWKHLQVFHFQLSFSPIGCPVEFFFFQFPVTVQEFGPISNVDICRQDPFRIAVTCSTKVQIFNPLTNGVDKLLTKFNGAAAYGGRFRQDGQLIGVGGDDGSVRIFDVSSKAMLRTLVRKGKKRSLLSGRDCLSTQCCDFMSDLHRLAGFSDDRSVTVWDVATEEVVATWDDAHEDYVRAGCSSEANADVLASGSYDHSVRLWDCRNGDGSTVSFDHGCPVESVMFLPSGALLASAGGREVKIWDLIAGKMLARLVPHNKTVTSLGLAMGNTRIVTASLDCQVKLHDVSTYQTVHAISFPSPVLTAAISGDDGVVCAGMSDGLIQFLHRKVPPSEAEREKERLQRKKGTMQHRYLQFTSFEPQPGDVIVKQGMVAKESRHDFFLRKFEYSKALDQVLKPYVQHKLPEYTYSVVRELKRRNGLRTAMGGRDEKSLKLLLQYLSKYINDPRFSCLLMAVTNIVLDLYGAQIGSCPSTDKLFVELRDRLDREARNMRQLVKLQGSIDLILAASVASDTCEFRSEEVAFHQSCQPDSSKLSGTGFSIGLIKGAG